VGPDLLAWSWRWRGNPKVDGDLSFGTGRDGDQFYPLGKVLKQFDGKRRGIADSKLGQDFSSSNMYAIASKPLDAQESPQHSPEFTENEG